MHAGFQPYGRVSVRGEQRRNAACDLRVVLLIVFPAVCLVVVLSEFLYLQEYFSTSSSAAERLVADDSARLRSEEDVNVTSMSAAVTDAPSTGNGRRTIIMVANYRDSTR